MFVQFPTGNKSSYNHMYLIGWLERREERGSNAVYSDGNVLKSYIRFDNSRRKTVVISENCHNK